MPHSSWGEPGLSRTVKIPCPGIQLNVHPELEVIFKELVRRLQEVRARYGKPPLTSSGGYNKRYISGTTRWSNHSWGLAGDFNASANPYSYTGGTDFPIAETRQICRDLGFHWGYDYEGKKDAMHFEYMGTREQARMLTAILNRGPIPNPAEEEDVVTEDEMNKIADKAADKVWAKILPKVGDVGPGAAWQTIGHAAHHAGLSSVTIGRVEKAISDLVGKGSGLTEDQVYTAVLKALKEGVVDVTVNVKEGQA